MLLPGGFERSAEAHLRSLLVRGIEAQPQLRVQPMQLWFIVHDAGLRDLVERLRYQAQSLPGLAGIAIGLCQEREPMRAFELGSGRAIDDEAFAQLSDPLFALPLPDERPAAQDHRMRAEKGNLFLRGKSQVYFRHLSGSSNLAAQLMQCCRPAQRACSANSMGHRRGDRDSMLGAC